MRPLRRVASAWTRPVQVLLLLLVLGRHVTELKQPRGIEQRVRQTDSLILSFTKY